MFTETKSDSDPPFIQNINMGWVEPFPSMFYCQVKFSVEQYDDELFTEFSIPFPDQLILAVVKRKAEYLAARYAAQKALKLFGCNETPGTSSNRSPVWPSEWCGSLSHSDECSIAVIAPKKSGMTPGVDIEFFAPETMRDTADMFVSADEKYVLSDSGIDYTTALLLIFSVKESLFKALYPEVGRFFNFDAAKVCRIDTSNKKITLELTQNLSRNRITGSRIEGYYSISDGRVITVVA
ncbi:4'-phosphopantetheinyl transferase family protein [Pantoea sp. JZ29]|uniref:4'-phosphopantetheinyl transferase family protein n=1 Tax=Pantoea sp. JZ29 TaxID=2654192 RepID=UPI002B470CF9|nr:4'-phosphopantetheinyl transferase superfamily protein [Pantoea sp. JZ29]